MDFQKIAIGSFPTLETGGGFRLVSKQLTPERLQVTARNPPSGRIDYVFPHHGEGKVVPLLVITRGWLGSADLRSEEKCGNTKSSSLLLRAADKNTLCRPDGAAGVAGRAPPICSEVWSHGPDRSRLEAL